MLRDDYECARCGTVPTEAELQRGSCPRCAEDRIAARLPMAACGCVYHAEQGIPCEHDLALRFRHATRTDRERP